MFKKNLKQILSSFEKTISQLDNLETSNLAAVETNKQEIAAIESENADLSTEAQAAKRVAENLRKILS